ncbi:MAG: pyridoxamine 5'-phosphate oxidase family protein [Pseudomonadota bacterium]
MPIQPEDFYDDIDKSWDDTRERLRDAVTNAKSKYRTGNLSYLDGDVPHIRTVVLRGASDDLSHIHFHTDYRSSKVKALSKHPQCNFHFYVPDDKLQIVATGTAIVHYQDGITQAAWDKTRRLSKRCYLADPAPGTQSDIPTAGFPEHFQNNTHKDDDAEAGYRNFCVVKIHVKNWDRVYLRSTGNRRIKYDFKDNQNTPEGRWLVP